MEMTSRERLKITLAGGQADRIPVTPDMSYMIPCKLTGKPFSDVLLNNDPPLWKAYLDAADYYGIDALMTCSDIGYVGKREYAERFEQVKDDAGNIYVTRVIDTPKGELREKIYYPPDNSDTPVEKLIKDFKEDLPKFRYLFHDIDRLDTTVYDEQVRMLGEKGVLYVPIFPAGMHTLVCFMNGLDAATYAYYDYPELLEEFTEWYSTYQLRKLDMVLDLKPDAILTGGSGSITLASPDMWDEMVFPTIKELTARCKQAGVISGIHSCGKEMHIVKRCAEETDLNFINPLELAPMGDCDLRTVKQLYGDKLCLMGNLHTTDVLLNGSPDEVRRASLQAILDAGEGGGFVLSSGDQPGRDTPEENIRAMVTAGHEFGRYPLDKAAITDALMQ